MMKNFKSKSNKLSNESLVILAMRVIETVNQSTVESAKTAKYFLQLTNAVNSYMNTIGTGGEQQYSKDIALLFDKRKLLFDEIYSYLYGLTKSPDSEIQQAASTLFEVVNRFGANYSRLKISDQSLRYMRIIETLKKADYTKALTKTLLTDKLVAIDTVQMDYENLYINRGNSQTVYKAATILRNEIETELKQFYDELNWFIKMNETEELVTLRLNIDKRMGEIYTSPRTNDKTNETPAQVA